MAHLRFPQLRRPTRLGVHSGCASPRTALRPRDTLRHSPTPQGPAIRNRRAVEPVLGNVVAARQPRQSHLRAPSVAVLPEPLRVASTECLLVHGPSLRRAD
jgi:hypothetical protein